MDDADTGPDESGQRDRPTVTRDGLVARLGLTEESARKLWNALGFAQSATPDKIFTDDQVEGIRVLVDAESTRPERVRVATARAIGQTMSRLAEWQADQLRELDDDPAVDWSVDQMTASLQLVQNLVWRRHLTQALATDEQRAGDVKMDLVVGFADIVGYTSLSRHVGLAALEDLLETFEERTHDIVIEHGGHVIKTLGDAVMFTFTDVGAAAQTALAIHRLGDSDPIPPLRAGLARGQVLTRMGDVFGEPVNIAARLTGVARPGTTLLDQLVAEQLSDDERFYLKSPPPISVRGYRRLRVSVLEANKHYAGDATGRSGTE